MELAIMGGVKDLRRTPLASGEQFIAVMGGIEVDLTQAPMQEEMHVSALAFMGAVKLIVPRGVEVTFAGFALMGGREFKRDHKEEQPEIYARLHVNAVAIMGGIEVVEV